MIGARVVARFQSEKKMIQRLGIHVPVLYNCIRNDVISFDLLKICILTVIILIRLQLYHINNQILFIHVTYKCLYTCDMMINVCGVIGCQRRVEGKHRMVQQTKKEVKNVE